MSTAPPAGRLPALTSALFGRLPEDGLTADQLTFFDEIVANDLSMPLRRGNGGFGQLDRRRDIRRECGYPTDLRLDAKSYWDLYGSDPVAARACEVYASECWQVVPEVVETHTGKKTTEFENAYDGLDGCLAEDGDSWFVAEEQGSVVCSHLKTLDVMSGIGQYAVLLYGFSDDPEDLKRPLGKRKYKAGGRTLRYLRAFPEHLAQITAREQDRTSPRYGRPTSYLLTLNSPEDREQVAGGSQTGTVQVHWSRVQHVTGHLPSHSRVYGVPLLQQLVWPLYDLQKIYGASGEGYWQAGFNGIALSTHPQLGSSVRTNDSQLKNMMENYTNGFQRYLVLKGLSATPLAPSVSDPTAHADKHLERICIRLGIPKRIFMGSERGELASSQDDVAWNDRVKERQLTHITPRIIAPFVDKLITAGVLPEPESFGVVWPDVTSMSAEQKAAVLTQQITALSTYKQGMLEEYITPQDVLVRVFDMTDEEAEETLCAAKEEFDKKQEEQQALQMEQQAAMIDEGLAPDPAAETPLDPTKLKEGEKLVPHPAQPKPPVANSKTKRTKRGK